MVTADKVIPTVEVDIGLSHKGSRNGAETMIRIVRLYKTIQYSQLILEILQNKYCRLNCDSTELCLTRI